MRFKKGEALALEATAPGLAAAEMRICYRRVDQAERWQSAPMEFRDARFRAAIPADYTMSPYPLQYYFEIRRPNLHPEMYPGFSPQLNNQPYFVVQGRA